MFVIVNKIILKWVVSKVRSNQSAANRDSDVGRSRINSRPHKNTVLHYFLAKEKHKFTLTS